MQQQTLKFKLTGVSPLLMHAPSLSIPTHPLYKDFKRVSGKRAKTEADILELAKLEWFGGLYLGSDGSPCMPAEAVEAMLVEAAKKSRKGQSAKAGLWVTENGVLEYEGPRDPHKLYELPQFTLTTGVRVQKNRINRTRPIFREWATTVEVTYLDEVLNASDIKECFKTAGVLIGLLDWRPKFGRFIAESVD